MQTTQANTATMTKMVKGDIDQAKLAKFVAAQAKAIRKAAARFGKEMTDSEVQAAAEQLGSIYGHQFRTLTPAN